MCPERELPDVVRVPASAHGGAAQQRKERTMELAIIGLVLFAMVLIMSAEIRRGQQ